MATREVTKLKKADILLVPSERTDIRASEELSKLVLDKFNEIKQLNVTAELVLSPEDKLVDKGYRIQGEALLNPEKISAFKRAVRKTQTKANVSIKEVEVLVHIAQF